MLEYKVNDYITLKQEGEKTNIYIKNRLFRQCSYVLIKKTSNDLEELLTLLSIDELKDKNLENILEEQPNSIDIDKKTEFWVHCSNLQAWVENDYNTNLLHSNLAFPLLKRLWQLNAPAAVNKFENELIRRFKEGYLNTVLYLLLEGYFNFIQKNNRSTVLLEKNSELKRNIKKGLKKESIEKEIPLLILLELFKNEDDKAKKILREFIVKCFEKSNREIISFLCEWGFFKIELFTIKELVNIIFNSEIKFFESLKNDRIDINEINNRNARQNLEEIICKINKNCLEF